MVFTALYCAINFHPSCCAFFAQFFFFIFMSIWFFHMLPSVSSLKRLREFFISKIPSHGKKENKREKITFNCWMKSEMLIVLEGKTHDCWCSCVYQASNVYVITIPSWCTLRFGCLFKQQPYQHKLCNHNNTTSRCQNKAKRTIGENLRCMPHRQGSVRWRKAASFIE